MAETSSEGAVSFDPRIVLRPRTLDEVFDLTFAYLRTYSRDFRRLFALQLLLGISLVVLLREVLEQTWPVIWAAAFVLSPLTEKVTLVFGGDHLFGNAPRRRLALRRVARRIVPVLVGAIIVPLPVLPALLLSLADETSLGFAVMASLFWPFLLAWFLYFNAALLLENLDLPGAFRRSSRLISFRFGRALVFVVVAFNIRLFFVVSFEFLCRFVVSFVLQLGNPFGHLFEDFGSYPSVLAFLLAAPIIALARMFDYVDTRTRLEGWDLQVRFKALVTKEPAARVRSVA